MARIRELERPDGSRARRRPRAGDLRWDGQAWRRWSGRRWAHAAYSPRPERLRQPSHPRNDPTIDEDARRRMLMRAVEDQVGSNGAEVLLDGPRGVVLGYRRPVAHGFHAVMTLLTGGLWLLVWAAAMGRRQRRIRLEVDEWGNVWSRRLVSA